MAWRRVGWIEVPRRRASWWASHAALPTVLEWSGNRFVLLVSSRDEGQRSSAAYLVVEVGAGSVELVVFGDRPLLEPGAPGCFDESGVNVTWCSGTTSSVTAWYHGWVLLKHGGWLNSIGRARGSLENGLVRDSFAPIFDRSFCDPTSIGYPYVYELGGESRIFYCSYEVFGVPPRGDVYSYRVKSASGDGMFRTEALLDHPEGMSAQSRPCLVRDGNIHRMFVSVKGDAYHVRGAESVDGVAWRWSGDEWSLQPAGYGGEVRETAYPYVVRQQNRLVMFYNGDGHGASGIGVAVWDD